jgi:hypothetical protein
MTLITILLLGCGTDTVQPGGSPREDDAEDLPDDTEAGPRPGVTITAPAEGGGFYFGTGLLTYEVTEWTLDAAAIGGAPVEGRGHAHVYVDEVLAGESFDGAFRLDALSAGTHALRVELAGNDHGEIGVEDRVDARVALPVVQIVSPAEATLLTRTNTPVSLAISDFAMTSDIGGEARFAEGYYRLTVDGAPYDWGTDAAVADVSRLMPGARTIGVELVHADGTSLEPPATDTVTVQVADTAVGVAIDTSFLPPDARWDAAAIPLSVSTSNFLLDGSSGRYHIYVDGGFYDVRSDASTAVCNLPPGEHLVEVRLTDGASSEIGVQDRVRVRITDDRPDVLVTYPGPRWTMRPAFTMTLAVENFRLTAPGGTNEQDVGHYVVSIDGVEHVRGSSDAIAIAGAPLGLHRFRVELVQKDGTALAPAAFTEFDLTIAEASP